MIITSLFTQPLFFIAWVLAIILALAWHEFFHALVSRLQGDTTAESQGRLTLNPLAHIDPLGALMLLTVGFGWGKPVPFNPYNLGNKRFGPALVALAGPASNFLMALISALLIKILLASNLVVINGFGMVFLVLFLFLNLALMVFNLIPIPPLDGSKILFALLPSSTAEFQETLEKWGPFILLGLVVLDSFGGLGVISSIVTGGIGLVGNLLLPDFNLLVGAILG